MRDLITRWDATEVVYKALRTPTPDYKKDPFHDSMSLAISMVRQIPSAQQWIPVTERLPENEGRYLVTNSRIGSWIIDVDQWYLGHWIKNDKPVAWMPIPEPYHPKEGRE